MHTSSHPNFVPEIYFVLIYTNTLFIDMNLFSKARLPAKTEMTSKPAKMVNNLETVLINRGEIGEHKYDAILLTT